MASLKDIAKSKGIEIGDKGQSLPSPAPFQKRRAWTQPEEPTEKSLDNQELIARKPLENDLKIVSQSLENHLKINRNGLDNHLETIGQSSPKPLGKELDNQESIIRKPLDISHLVGKEMVLVCHIVSLCKNKGSLITGTVLSDDLKQLLEVDNNGLGNLVFRVKEKGFLDIVELKKGRVSWRKFSVPKEIYEQILQKGLENHTAINRKALDKALDKPLEMAPCSSSSLKNINNYNNIEIPENLAQIGFGSKHISQILELGKLTEIELQDSLYHFSQDLQVGLKVKVKTSPLGLLIGILRNGSAYISEDFLNSFKADLEKSKARVQEYEALQKQLQENAMKEKFIAWKEENPSELEQIISEIKTENTFIANSPGFLEAMVFQKWEETSKNQ